jgi:hypothetical protein
MYINYIALYLYLLYTHTHTHTHTLMGTVVLAGAVARPDTQAAAAGPRAAHHSARYLAPPLLPKLALFQTYHSCRASCSPTPTSRALPRLQKAHAQKAHALGGWATR